jgi:hypothetical protein
MQVEAWEEDEPGLSWPVPLAGGQALGAVRRLQDEIAPAQGQQARAAGLTGRLLAPGGRRELAPLRLADVDPADVTVLASAAAVLGAPGAPYHVREVLAYGAEIACGAGDDEGCARLAGTITRLAGLLAMEPDRDSELLAALVDSGGPADDVVLTAGSLTAGSEAAYRRYMGRARKMWRSWE